MKIFLLLLLLTSYCTSNAQQLAVQNNEAHYHIDTNGAILLHPKGASYFAQLALKCISQEFPNKTGHVQTDSSDLYNPATYHPAFFGCYDWHSAVHGHWMLVKLLKKFPDIPETTDIRKAIASNLTAENILKEVEYFQLPSSKSFERMYGWAWLLKLAEELYTSTNEQNRKWYNNLQPLAQLIAERYIEFLPKQTYPIRSGVHPNTAFGLSLALDYAIAVGDKTLENAIKSRALFYYQNDTDCPGSWEPSGADFLSPCLAEAELMSKVLDKKLFNEWLNGFLPQLNEGKPVQLFTPAVVGNRNDMQLVHLDGLNLSRAWCLQAIAKKVDNSELTNLLKQTAANHLKATLPNIASGDYAGEHWLASFAILALFS